MAVALRSKPWVAERVTKLPGDAKWEQLILRVGFIATGALQLDTAWRMWGHGRAGSHDETVWLVFIGYAIAFSLLAIGVMSLQRMERFVPLIGISILFTLISWAYIDIEITHTIYRTDNAALTHVAAERLLDGDNPYSINNPIIVEEVVDRFGLPSTFMTSTTDAEPITNLMSYPAGIVLVLAPPIALGLDDVRWVIVAFQITAFALLWWRAPSVIRPLAAIPLIIDQDLFLLFTGGGVQDFIWVTPMIACAIALYSRRLGWAALLYGLAAGIKQQPWLLAPFLLIWVWQTTNGSWEKRGLSVAQFGALATGGFLILNLPFMIWNFSDWLRGVLLPLRETMVPFGSGISLLTQAGIVSLPKSFYTAATLGVSAVLMIAYMLHFKLLRHALWLAPAIIMWFGYRGLQNYFVYWIPVLLVALFVWWEEAQEEPLEADQAEVQP